jgi:hypothetical protein
MPVNMSIEAWRWYSLMNEGVRELKDGGLSFREAHRQVYYSKLAGLITPWRLGEYPARGVLEVQRDKVQSTKSVMAKVLAMGAVGSATMTVAIVAAGVVAMLIDNWQWTMDNGQWAMDEELERQMYETLIDRLAEAGYEHYEISNFARQKASPKGGGWRDGEETKASPTGGGWRGLHNSSYWTDVHYIGIGAAAHSYDGRQRRWNVSDLRKYINGIESGKPVFEFEDIDADTRYNDRVMLSLRTKEGLDLLTLSEAERDYLLPLAQKYLDEGLLTRADQHLRLSRKGLFVSNMIMSDLMKV